MPDLSAEPANKGKFASMHSIVQTPTQSTSTGHIHTREEGDREEEWWMMPNDAD